MEDTYEDIIGSAFVHEVYERTEDYADSWFFEDESDEADDEAYEDERDEYTLRGLSIDARVMQDIDALEGAHLFPYGDGLYTIELAEHHPIVALMLDGKVRYEYTGVDLLFYMMDLFGPHKGFHPREDQDLNDQCA